jgi:hypothetical protein
MRMTIRIDPNRAADVDAPVGSEAVDHADRVAADGIGIKRATRMMLAIHAGKRTMSMTRTTMIASNAIVLEMQKSPPGSMQFLR